MAETPKCFVIMPITTPDDWIAAYRGDGDHFHHVLEHLFTPAVEDAGYEVLPPSSEGADIIHAEIIRKLETADLVLCDASTLNPNVFFELGIRTSLDRPVCVVCDDQTPRLPFDTGIVNTQRYKSLLAPWFLDAEVEKLSRHIADSAQRSDGHNPMWKYFGLTQRGTPAAESVGEDPRGEKLDLILAEVSRLRSVQEQDEAQTARQRPSQPAYLYTGGDMTWLENEIQMILIDVSATDDDFKVIPTDTATHGLSPEMVVVRRGQRGVVYPALPMTNFARRVREVRQAHATDNVLVVLPNPQDVPDIQPSRSGVRYVALGELRDVLRAGWPAA